MVSRPMVDYLLDKGYKVTIGDINEEQAKNVINGHPNGHALRLDIADIEPIRALVAEADLAISLLPPQFHIGVAELCLKENKHFLCASYLSQDMKNLDERAKARGLVFLNEVGLDPGLDHLTAMEMIDELKDNGYEILEFHSHCGGIPSLKAANNPLRYKFSWSPAGVLRAITRASKFQRDGRLVTVPGRDKLNHAEVLHVPGAGIFESNPNADSLYYGERYGLTDVHTIRRGTLRYPGWAQFWLFMLSLDFLNEERVMEFDDEQVLSALFRLSGNDPPADIYSFVAERAQSHASVFLEGMESLGLLDQDNRISGSYSAFSIILAGAQERMQYAPDEMDLVVLHHEFTVQKDGKREKWTSSMIREGNEDATAMAFLVGVPAGIAARLILEDKIEGRGALIPLTPDIYGPLLKELAELGLPHEIQKVPLD